MLLVQRAGARLQSVQTEHPCTELGMVHFDCPVKDSFRDSCEIETPTEAVFSSISFLNEIPTSSGANRVAAAGCPVADDKALFATNTFETDRTV
jgi:hypothetical protein